MANVENAAMLENGSNKGNKQEILDFVQYVKNRIKFVIIPMLIAAMLAGIYSYIIATPKYEATAQLYVVNSKDSAINLSDLQIGSYLTSDYQWIFKTWEVNQQVINNLQLPYSMREMQRRLTVENPANTRILLITFACENAKMAAAVANEYAEVASQYISDYMLTSKPSQISTALEPLAPASPKKMLIMAVSMFLTGFIAVWCLFVAFLLDDKIKAADDISKYMGVAPLAVVPVAKNAGNLRKGR